MDEDIKKELEKVCLEEDYQEHMDKVLKQILGDHKENVIMSCEECLHQLDVLIEEMRKWKKD